MAQWESCDSCGNDWCNIHDCHTHDASCECQPLCDRHDDPMLLRLSAVLPARRLTPKETERLQGFPDDYTAVAKDGRPSTDRNRYRALGNSMAVPCMFWLGYRIQQATR